MKTGGEQVIRKFTSASLGDANTNKSFIFTGHGQSGQTDQCNAKQGRRKVKKLGGTLPIDLLWE